MPIYHQDFLPSARVLRKIHTKNNIAERELKQKISLFERECHLNITSIDLDRLDVKDFLTELRICKSDSLLESRHWLGDRTPSGRRVPRTTRLIIRNQSANANLELEEEARREELARQERERTQYKNFGSQRKPELVQRTMTLHRLFAKRNEYAGMDQAWDSGSSGLNDPASPDRELLESRGNVTFKDSGIGMESETQTRTPDFDNDEKRVKSRRSERLEGLKEEQLKHDCGRPGCEGHKSQGQGHGDFMKELLVGKYKKKRKKKEPLEDRITGFFQKMEIIKKEDKKRTKTPTPQEMHRRWLALTKGAKLALQESSDEEEGDPLNTI